MTTTTTQKIPAGYKQTEIGTIPADWDVKRLGDIGECLIGLTYKPSDVSYSGMLVLRSSNIQNDQLAFEDNVYVNVDVPERIKVKKGDILICVRNGSRNLIGKCALLDSRVEGQTFGAFMSVFRTPHYNYIYHQFQSNIIQRQINENIGATINQITNKNLNSFRIAFPNKAEERSIISTVLSDIDALIEKLERLIEKKKNIKQGAMQALLTGKQRLPGFSDEWETKKLGEMADIKKGQLITDSTRIDGSIPVIAGGKTAAYFHNKANRFGKTITVSGSGASAGYVAFHANPIFASDCSTIEESTNYSIEFIYSFLQLMQERIYKMQTGGAQPHIHPNDLNPIPISVPKPDEQSAIATIFSDMDTEIEKLESQLTKYQNLKQGMMQTLLTGKIRLI